MTDTEILDYLQSSVRVTNKRVPQDVQIGSVVIWKISGRSDLRKELEAAIKRDAPRLAAAVASRLMS